MGPVVRGSAGDDTVVVFGIALRLHQGLPATVRAGAEVGPLRTFFVKLANDCLGLDGGLVDRPMSEVDDLLRVAQSPGGAHPAAFVAGVGCGRGVSPANRARQAARAVVDGTCIAAVADALQLPVPARSREPYLEPDVGVVAGLDDSGHPAKGRQASNRGGLGRSKRAGWNRHCGFDCRCRHLELRQTLTACSRDRKAAPGKPRPEHDGGRVNGIAAFRSEQVFSELHWLSSKYASLEAEPKPPGVNACRPHGSRHRKLAAQSEKAGH